MQTDRAQIAAVRHARILIGVRDDDSAKTYRLASKESSRIVKSYAFISTARSRIAAAPDAAQPTMSS